MDKFVIELENIFNENELILIMYKYYKTRIFVIEYDADYISFDLDNLNDMYIEETESYIRKFGNTHKSIYGNIMSSFKDDNLDLLNLDTMIIETKNISLRYVKHDKIITDTDNLWKIYDFNLNLLRSFIVYNYPIINDNFMLIECFDHSNTYTVFKFSDYSEINISHSNKHVLYFNGYIIKMEIILDTCINKVYKDDIFICEFGSDIITKHGLLCDTYIDIANDLFALNPLRMINQFGETLILLDEHNKHEYHKVFKLGEYIICTCLDDTHDDHIIIFKNSNEVIIIDGFIINCNNENFICIRDIDMLTFYDKELKIVLNWNVKGVHVNKVLIY